LREIFGAPDVLLVYWISAEWTFLPSVDSFVLQILQQTWVAEYMPAFSHPWHTHLTHRLQTDRTNNFLWWCWRRWCIQHFYYVLPLHNVRRVGDIL